MSLTIRVWHGGSQNFATYLLWGLLDGAVAGTSFVQHGNFILPLVYTIWCAIVCAGVWRKSTVEWGWTEILTAGFVGAGFIWWAIDPKVALIIASVGAGVASIPQMKDAWKDPRDATLFEYSLFFAANLVSTFAGKNWSIQERFYPGFSTIVALGLVAVAARKLLPRFKKK